MAVARRKRQPERGSLDEIMMPDGSRAPGWQDWAKANGWEVLEVLLEAGRRRRAWHGVARQTDAAIDATEIINVSGVTDRPSFSSSRRPGCHTEDDEGKITNGTN